MNVGTEVCHFTGIKVASGKEIFKEKFGNFARETFKRFATKDIYTRNITPSTEV